MIYRLKLWIFNKWFLNLFLGALDCLDLDVDIAKQSKLDDECITLGKQTNQGTISFRKLFECDRVNVRKLINQVYLMKVSSSRKKYSASSGQMQQFVYGTGALSKQQIDECVAYCLMIERGQIKLKEVA